MKLYFQSWLLYNCLSFLNVNFGIPVFFLGLGDEPSVQSHTRSLLYPTAPLGFRLFSALLASALLILISVKLWDMQCQQLKLSRLLSAQGAITWQPSHWGCCGPWRTHILQKEANQGRSSWQGHGKGGLQSVGDLICEDLMWSPFGTRQCRWLCVHFLWAVFEDSFDCAVIALLEGHRTVLQSLPPSFTCLAAQSCLGHAQPALCWGEDVRCLRGCGGAFEMV